MDLFKRIALGSKSIHFSARNNGKGVWTDQGQLIVRFFPCHTSGTIEVRSWYLQLETKTWCWEFKTGFTFKKVRKSAREV